MARIEPNLARAGALAAALQLALTPPLAATEPQRRLDEIERTLEAEKEAKARLAREADTIARELAGVRARATALAAALQAQEERLSQLEADEARLEADAAAKSANLEERRAELARLTAALARLGRQPPEAVLLVPGSPLDTVRAARLLGGAVPAVSAQAEALARDIRDLDAARARLLAQRDEVASARSKLADDRAALAVAIEHRGRLLQANESAQRDAGLRIERLTRDARDVRDLMARLEAERAAREAAARAAAEKAMAAEAAARTAREAQAAMVPPRPAPDGVPGAAMVPPVRGRIVLAYGQPGEAGQPHRGLTIETRPAAQVVATGNGQVVFAGPFRGYGLILIIEHADGYHTLLAGLGRIDAVVGQAIAVGEPVGAAGSPETGSPSVYVELRRQGQPVNPMPLLAPRNEKVSG